jgi:uncharacterized membrane-anchored protein YhcB (DUF1043 family)
MQFNKNNQAINNLKEDFSELYKSVFNDADEVQLLTKVESRFVRDYMKPQDKKNDKQKNNTNKTET